MVAGRTLEQIRLTGMTTSIGIAEYADGLSVDEIVKRADAALYESKKNGRDRVTVYSALP
jgi:PleD family two-component response regulator